MGALIPFPTRTATRIADPCSSDRNERGNPVAYRMTTVERTGKTAEAIARRKASRHYQREARRAIPARRLERAITLFCFAVVAWIVAIFAAAYIGGAA